MTDYMFAYKELIKAGYQDPPVDFCPACPFFEDDYLPLCNHPGYGEVKEVKWNGTAILVSCPLQLEYLDKLEKENLKIQLQ